MKLKCVRCGKEENIFEGFKTDVKFNNFDWDNYECSKCVREKSDNGLKDLIIMKDKHN